MKTNNLARERALYSAMADRAQQGVRRKLASLQEQMTTQLRVNRASDDPTAFAEARRHEALAGRLEQHQRAIGQARSWGEATHAHLDAMAELFTRAGEYAVQGANDTNALDERAALADQVDALRAELIGQMNAKQGDEYLFGGVDTAGPAFDAAGEPSPMPRDYTRIAGPRMRQIGEQLTLKTNITGAELHQVGGGAAITDSLQNLSAALRANDGAAIRTAMGEVADSRNHVLQLASQNGTMLGRLAATDSAYDDAVIRLKARQSDLEDADYIELTMDYQKSQRQLEAALKVTASALKTTLLDYV